MNQQLLIVQNQFNSILNNTNDCVFRLDIDGFFLESNKATETIIGYTPFELIGTSFAQIIAIKDYLKVKKIFQNVLSGKTEQYEAILVHKNNVEVYMEITSFPIEVENKIIGILVIAKERKSF